ncbi:unnamed protein product [Pleuronectes platessa]|uniref:Uncharacterized protein n=1 Tax=Pleuronectes platessa TaxID=8262 RepID=A0A9N7YJS5_PLEPL|nr:unnamed protein product [Pleuronectes platessa]
MHHIITTTQQPELHRLPTHPSCLVYSRSSLINLWWLNRNHSPALTEDAERKPSRSSSTAADETGVAILLLLLLAGLHILRGPSRASHPTGGRERASPVRASGLVVPATSAHLNLDAAAGAQHWPREEGGDGVRVAFRYRDSVRQLVTERRRALFARRWERSEECASAAGCSHR